MTNKEKREAVYEKCQGHCAYCGKNISIKEMQVDHIEPHWHTLTEDQALKVGIKKGSHDLENLNPSCARCNKWKSTFSLESFRKVVETSLDRLERDTPNFRLARDFGLLKTNRHSVKFYFENRTNLGN
jgi:5-methylcytosine-specific restriction endonuclease McrA